MNASRYACIYIQEDRPVRRDTYRSPVSPMFLSFLRLTQRYVDFVANQTRWARRTAKGRALIESFFLGGGLPLFGRGGRVDHLILHLHF